MNEKKWFVLALKLFAIWQILDFADDLAFVINIESGHYRPTLGDANAYFLLAFTHVVAAAVLFIVARNMPTGSDGN